MLFGCLNVYAILINIAITAEIPAGVISARNASISNQVIFTTCTCRCTTITNDGSTQRTGSIPNRAGTCSLCSVLRLLLLRRDEVMQSAFDQVVAVLGVAGVHAPRYRFRGQQVAAAWQWNWRRCARISFCCSIIGCVTISIAVSKLLTADAVNVTHNLFQIGTANERAAQKTNENEYNKPAKKHILT